MKDKKNRGWVDRIILYSDKAVILLTEVLVALLLIFSVYVLWDMSYSDRTAFSSWELLKYRPSVEEGEEPTFNELRSINPDVVGWLTVYNTNIDYPVVQGKDDMEYVSRDVYGEFKLTGSIFLTSENKKDFSDPYNVIYGHHMDNKAMFGGIDDYKTQSYLDSHHDGALITPNGIYKLDIFACITTDAYEKKVYDVNAKKDGNLSELKKYAEKHQKTRRMSGIGFWDNASYDDSSRRVVALSTCATGDTAGRTVLLAEMSAADEAYLRSHESTSDKNLMEAEGHGKNEYWAVLNLICILLSLLITFPIHKVKEKFGKKYIHKKRLSYTIYVIEGVLLVVGVVFFILTEDMRLPVTILDKWTPVMILIYAVILGLDMIVWYKNKPAYEKADKQINDETNSKAENKAFEG